MFHLCPKMHQPVKLIAPMVIFLLSFQMSCGNPSSSKGGLGGKTGSSNEGGLSVQIVRSEAPTASPYAALRRLDCASDQVEDIEAYIYGPDNRLTQTGGPWKCADSQQGIIEQVPAGTDLRVVIVGISSGQEVILYGEEGDVEVVAGQTAQVGPIVIDNFTPTHLSPPDNSEQIQGQDLVLEWQLVAGAQAYSVEIAANPEFEGATRHDGLATTSLTLPTATGLGTYYWRVKAQDDQNQQSPWTAAWAYTLSETPRPLMAISPPAGGTLAPGDTYDFGNQNVYASSHVTFKIQNTGTAELSLTAIELISGHVDDFSIDISGTQMALAPGQETTFTVNSRSLTGGNRSALINITNNADPLEFTVSQNAYDFHGISILDSIDDVGMHTSIAVNMGRIFICYYDETNQRLKVAKSFNDGIDWSFSTINAGTGTGIGKGSSIAMDGDHIFISTTLDSLESNGEIALAKSEDAGDTWNAQAIVVDGYAFTQNEYYDEFSTTIAVDGQHVYLANLGSFLLMETYKAPYGGQDWSHTRVPAPPDDYENGYYASMAISNNTLYISHSGYMEADIHFTKMPDSMSAHTNVRVDEISTMGDRGYTSIAVEPFGSGAHVYIAYFDQSTGNNNLNFARSINNGDNFSIAVVDNASTSVGKYASMAVSDGVIFIGYYDETNQNLKLAISDDEGDTWEIKTVDAASDNVGRFASLAAKAGKVYISYYDETNKCLKFAKSIDAGNTWN